MNQPSNQPTNRYVTCRCQHCNGGIEFDAVNFAEETSLIPCPHCGLGTKLFLPDSAATFHAPMNLAPLPAIHIPPTENPASQIPKQKKTAFSRLAKLTPETIRATTKSGDTPLHRAAKTGKISEIPRHLLCTELFLAQNNSCRTPLHLAAEYGHLDQIPPEFLTKETLTVSTEYSNKESRTGPTPPRTRTPLHTAALFGHADQVPKEFLIPEILALSATGYRSTVLHDLAASNCLHLVPNIYATSEMWNLRNSSGQTPREVLERNLKREVYVERVRKEPATEKQKEKLRYFGCTWDEGITKGQASDALDEIVRRFPEKNAEYYNRPATEEQREKLRYLGKNPDQDLSDTGELLTYEQAKDWIWECEMDKRRDEMDKSTAYWNSEAGQMEQALAAR